MIGVSNESCTDVKHKLPDRSATALRQLIPFCWRNVMKIPEDRVPVVPSEPMFFQDVIEERYEFSNGEPRSMLGHRVLLLRG
jgi:hypothetical protein